MTDVRLVAPAQRGAKAPSPAVKALAALLLPLFFVVVFPLAFVSALHKPAPHDLPILVVGSSQVVSKLATDLDDTASFRATQTDVVSAARSGVEDRTVDGAVQVTAVPAAKSGASPTYTVRTYVATAEGRSVAAAVEGAGSTIAAKLGTTATVVDVAPLAVTDELGVTLFYLFAYTSLAGYLVIIVLTQVMPGARLRVRFLASAITAAVAPLIGFGLASIWVGDYGASFGTIAALLGVNALSVFTIGAAAILLQQFLGTATTFGVMAFIVFLNFTSAGGAGPAAMLPPFWQFVHGFSFGAGAYESFRSLVYFGGNGAGRWLLQLCLWTVGLVLAVVVVHLAKTTRRQQEEISALTAVALLREPDLASASERTPHLSVELVVTRNDRPATVPGDQTERGALTVGEGASR